MTLVVISPVPGGASGLAYRAVSGEREAQGATAGAALDALAAQLPADEAGTLVIVQERQPDRFFDAAQQQRLAQLITRWRAARDAGQELPDQEQTELDALVEAELNAAGARAGALADEAGR